MKIHNSSLSSSAPLDQTAVSCMGFHPSSVILGIFVFFLFLVLCESLCMYVRMYIFLIVRQCILNIRISYLLTIATYIRIYINDNS